MSAPNLTESFSAARARGGALLLPYGMAGLPSIDESVDLFAAMADGGADGFEVGIPYRDPLMDGPVIQEAGSRALLGGMTMRAGLEVTRRVRERTGLPCVVMTYVNPILRMGEFDFSESVAASGAEAVIVADLPADEAAPLRAALSARGVGLVVFAAPTTPDERLATIDEMQPPFVYAIAEMGVTGERASASDRAAALVEGVRRHTERPIALGVGIASPEAAAAAAAIADGVIVGSALVRRVLDAASAIDAARDLGTAVAEFRRAMSEA